MHSTRLAATVLLGAAALVVARDPGASWASAGQGGARRIADLDPTTLRDDHGADRFVAFNGALYFRCSRREWGTELFRATTATTTADLTVVRDIFPGPRSSDPAGMTPGTGVLFFAADDGSRGMELWKTDGTDAGTVPVGGAGSDPSDFFSYQGALYFSATTEAAGRELWKSDGTAAGTTLLADLQPGPQDSAPREFTAFGGKIWFVATTSASGSELWTTDTTTAGTSQFADVLPGADSLEPNSLTPLSTRMLFIARDAAGGYELWATDGTVGGTARVMDIRPGDASSNLRDLVVLNDRAYFTADDGVHGQELWTSDGTPGGTSMVYDVSPGAASGVPYGIDVAQGVVWFAGDTAATGTEPWFSNGTPEGTGLVRDLLPGPQGSLGSTEFIGAAGRVFFSARDATDYELWSTTGTDAGTTKVDVLPGSESSFPHELTSFANECWFVALDADGIRSLWRSDATTQGTTRVAEFGRDGGGSDPRGFVTRGEAVLFGASSLATGPELWRTDGTADGTSVVLDARPGPEGAAPNGLTVAGNLAYYTAGSPTAGDELWRSDGSESGTRVVKDVNPGPEGSSPGHLTAFGGRVLFTAYDNVRGSQLWVTDGSEPGTVPLTDFPAGISRDSLSSVVVRRGLAYFDGSADDGAPEPWVTDGTPEGTHVLREIAPGATAGSDPHAFVAFARGVLFVATTPPAGPALWFTDGSEAGTVAVGELGKAAKTYFFEQPVGAVDRVFFVGADAPPADEGETPQGTGRELWMTDGTAAGTRLVKDITSGPAGTYIQNLTRMGHDIVFVAPGAASGFEPWKSDGTAKGTSMLADVLPGATGSQPDNFATLGALSGVVFFTAGDRTHGVELWRTDGTAAGTAMFEDGCPGRGNTVLSSLTFGPLGLFAQSYDPAGGAEPWHVPFAELGLTQSDRDSDGDAYSDEIEAAAGSSAQDWFDTPDGAAAGDVAGEVRSGKATIKLRFDRAGKDAVVLTGQLPVSRGFTPLGRTVVVDVGGVTQKFVLTKNGSASIRGVGTFRISLKLSRGAAAANPAAKFTLSLSKGSFAAALADESLTGSASVTKAARRVAVQVVFAGGLYRSRLPVSWSAKSGVSGTGR